MTDTGEGKEGKETSRGKEGKESVQGQETGQGRESEERELMNEREKREASGSGKSIHQMKRGDRHRRGEIGARDNQRKSGKRQVPGKRDRTVKREGKERVDE